MSGPVRFGRASQFRRVTIWLGIGMPASDGPDAMRIRISRASSSAYQPLVPLAKTGYTRWSRRRKRVMKLMVPPVVFLFLISTVPITLTLTSIVRTCGRPRITVTR